MSLRDRLLTPKVAKAMLSPSAIVLAGAGAAAGVLAGFGPVAAVVGIGAWAARVAFAVPAKPGAGEEPIRPNELDEPWRTFVTNALASEARFELAVRDARPGPVTDRLRQMNDRIDDGVRQVWRVARRGQARSRGRAVLDVEGVSARLDAARKNRDDAGGQGRTDLVDLYEREIAALEGELGTARGLEDDVQTTWGRLRALDAQLSQVSAQAVALAAQAGDVTDLVGLDRDVDSVVTELEAIRLALDEVEGV